MRRMARITEVKQNKNELSTCNRSVIIMQLTDRKIEVYIG